ncbi:glycosyltransferase family 4 protein [Paenibacillus sp. N3/727]|uniref:glycosyltransferase family 4 protein n=1 Tax=Paenibacillus sp. N3/727 TaxID=2925845 RepID=UPI001F53347F|nr:glycosyltransferase family 4 protein [Paenibacillus sp. N3/727]UNK18765.1 glycosyltransferase family 4 protein [Paenibacillus sp. N3/727]
MKICFVTHKVKKGDGQGRVNYEVIMEALKEGCEVMVISSELSEDLQNHAMVEWIRIKVPKIPTVLLRYQIFAVTSAFSIWLRQSSIDLLVVNGFITYARSDINCVHFVHSSWVKSKYHPFRERKDIRTLYQFVYNRLNAILERVALKRTRHIIAVSEKVKRDLVFDAKIGSPRISVIHNGVDTEEFYPRQANRSNYKLDEHMTYALFAGDLNSGIKNLDTVFHALSEVEDIHLLVLGDPERSRYPKLAEQLGLGKRVHFLGYRKDIADIMPLADLFIFPSRYETFSLVILEAMASGLPVIISSSCGVAELLSEDGAVVIEDPDDVKSLANVLRELVSNPKRLERMALLAREEALRNHWGVMANKYMEIFQHSTNSDRLPVSKQA